MFSFPMPFEITQEPREMYSRNTVLMQKTIKL